MRLLKAFLFSLLLSTSAFAADAVTSNVIFQNATNYVIHLTNVSDGTGESDVVKADKSALSVATDGAEADSLDIDAIAWNTNGMAVRVEWDHTTDDVATILDSHGYINFRSLRDLFVPNILSTPGLKDPRSTGATGDILFTTIGHTSGDTYNITLWLRKNAS